MSALLLMLASAMFWILDGVVHKDVLAVLAGLCALVASAVTVL